MSICLVMRLHRENAVILDNLVYAGHIDSGKLTTQIKLFKFGNNINNKAISRDGIIYGPKNLGKLFIMYPDAKTSFSVP